jgi:tetratricopeptide (TPR) repeat protein
LNGRNSLAAAGACALAIAAPLGASAQSGTENYYYPPKIASFGKSSIPIAGPGNVIVKVLVKADGTFVVSGILKTSNPGDNATALDIAKHSTYHPAGRGLAKKPITAYYDFAVKFTGSGASNGDEAAASGALGGPEADMRAGKYTDAQSALTSYIAGHPEDQKAFVDLAVTDVFLNDYPGAAAAFDKVTALPDSDKAIAVKAYSEASAAAQKAGKNDDAVAYAKKVLALAPTAYSYNTLGTAEHAAGDDAAAVADLDKARGMSASLKADDRVAIDLNLLSVLYAAGKDDQAAPVIAEVNSLAPGNVGLQNVTANHYIKIAQAADAASKPGEAEAAWEQAAIAAPSQASSFYGHAAIDELTKKDGVDLAKARGDAEKALLTDPNSAVANYVIGYVLAKQGKKTDALTYLKKADASAKSGTDSGLTSGIESLIKQVNGS